MRILPFTLLCAALCVATGSVLAEDHAGLPGGRDAGVVYAQFCANCHGPGLEGGKGPSLTTGRWQHGGDDASLRRSIREGYPLAGMPGFAPTLGDADTTAMIVFLREVSMHKIDPPGETQPRPTTVQHSEQHAYRIETVAENLAVPWSLAFLPDGRMLVTERPGRLRLIEHGQLIPAPIADVPAVVARDEAGLMSVVAHPDFAHNGWVYLSFSDPGDGDTAMTKIVRGRIRDGRLVDQQTVFAAPRASYQKGWVSFGSRLAFDSDYLFFSVGDRGLADDAQDLTKPNGKVHRVFADGRTPPDNPFAQKSGACATIWTYGHRNPQGLARNPVDGTLWETEHGPRGGDELNFLRAGRNYGWPVVTYGMNYDGTPISDHTEQAGMEPPIAFWTPSIAVSEMEFYTGDRFPAWKHNLFIGSLAQQKFLRYVVDGNRIVHREEVFKNYGRVRDIKTGPDGLIYLALEIPAHPGCIVRLVPAE